MKILLTGATGFVGRKLLNLLVNNGCTVLIIARMKTNLSEIGNIIKDLDVEYVENDNIEAIFKRHKDIELIIHAATDYGLKKSSNFRVYRANVELPINLLELAIKNNIKKFINLDTFFNSKSVSYGYLKSYILSKRQFQEWGELISNEEEISFINLRLYHVYGEGDGLHKFVPTIIRRCQAGEDIDLTAGVQKRDFIHVDDVVEAIALIAKASLNSGYHHFDIGSGESMSIREFVELVNRFCGNKAKLNFGALNVRAGEWSDIKADLSSLHKLGWNRRINIENGLKKMCNSP